MNINIQLDIAAWPKEIDDTANACTAQPSSPYLADDCERLMQRVIRQLDSDVCVNGDHVRQVQPGEDADYTLCFATYRRRDLEAIIEADNDKLSKGSAVKDNLIVVSIPDMLRDWAYQYSIGRVYYFDEYVIATAVAEMSRAVKHT